MKIKFLYTFLIKINLYLTKLINKLDECEDKEKANKFDALTPIDDAQDKETYFTALNEALSNNDIKNIALTGTYGSGKSSIIKTFQKKYTNNEYLNISLASFKDSLGSNNDNSEIDDRVNRLIELSILQQIFYKERPKDIPDSRFKRIKNIGKKKVIFESLSFLVWIISITYLLKQEKINKDFPEIWTNLNPIYIKYICLILSLIGVYYIIIKLVRVFNNSKLNKLNIQSADIEIGDNSDKSILNHHLDEILYFFEVTKYSIVVIEDLDRFNNTEIFTKLREINNLINGSKQINRKIVFLYAIKDDMFQDKDRAKFFDFIIPVIPIINSSNSNEIIKGKLKKFNISNSPSEEFIDDVSIFIEDMRLLTNVCNEYLLYKENLGEKLNQNNLFAMIIYKNLYPEDFADLHNGRGKIYNLIIDKPSYIKNKITQIDNSINSLKKQINNIESETINDIQELRSIYIIEIIKKIPNALSIRFNRKDYSFPDLKEDEAFKLIKDATDLTYNFYSNSYNSNYNYTNTTIKFSFNEVETSVNDEFTYDERENFLHEKETDKVNELKKNIEKLNTEKNDIKTWPLCKVLVSVDTQQILSNIDIEDRKLISFLLVNGFIDENYYDYISYFHEGSLTKQDWEFLQNVKSQTPTVYNFKLNKPGNLVKKINDNEFERETILNYDLLDYLLNDKLNHSKKIGFIFKQLSNGNENTFNYVKGFIENGVNQQEFIKVICNTWQGFWSFIEEKSLFTNEKKDEYLKLIFKYSHIEDIKVQSKNSKLVEYINSKNDFLSFINNEQPLDEIEKIITELKIKLSTIEAPAVNEALFEIIYDNNAYLINHDNIATILKYFEQDISEIETANYTTIQLSACEDLKSYVEEKIDFYIKEVVLKLSENKSESENYYVELLNNENITTNNIIALVNKTDTLISDINSIKVAGIPEILLRAFKVSPKWDNLFQYFQDSENKLDGALIKFLNHKNNYDELSKVIISKSKEGHYPIFREQILLCQNLSDEAYASLSKSISFNRDKLLFENLSSSKVQILIENILNLTIDNYNMLRENFANQHIDLINKQPKTYISKFEEFEIDSDDLLLILSLTSFTLDQKIQIILKVKRELIFESVQTSDKVCDIISNISKQDGIDYIFVQNLFSKAKNVMNKLKVFNIYYKNFTIDNIDILLGLIPYPYSHIAKRGKRPEIGKTNVDIELANNLKRIGYISSIKEMKNGIKINTKLK